MSLTPGARLGVYEIVAAIGVGGMGEVYRARDPKLNRDVAIKVLLPSVANDPDRLARFSREAQVLASLNHPHIAQIHGLEDANGVRALVMELVEGPTLADRIATGPIRLDDALPIAKQIAEALETAHEQGIIHRDLKPTNIKVRPDGTVKVLDFGLAKAMEPAGVSSANAMVSPTLSHHATEDGIILGTAAYMSPEQAAGKPVDKRSDLWAFGVVLLEMLTGHRPFAGDTAAETMAAVMMKEPDWTGLPQATPASIRRLLRRCLEKDRKRRLPDAAAARLEIEDALTAPAELLVTPTAQSSRARWRSAASLGAALLGGGAIAIGAMLLLRRAGPEALVTRLEITTPATTSPLQFALSPDGRRLAFVVSTSQTTGQLWVRALDQVSPQPLAGTENASGPFWSPDGRRLGFFADGKLKLVDLVTAGAPVVLADVNLNGGGGTWNAEGVIVFGAGPGRPLMRVPASGGTAVEVTHVGAGERGHLGPQFLPDGRHLLFFEVLSGQQQGTVAVASLDGGEPTPVVGSATAAAYAPPGYLLRVSQGVLVAQRFDAARASLSGDPIPVAQGIFENVANFRAGFSVSAAGLLAHRSGGGAAQHQLVWLDRTGKVLGTIGPPDENATTSFSLSRDGRRVANARQVQGNYDVWLTDVARGVPTRFTFDPAGDLSPVWSPDDTRVVFRSLNRNGFGASDLFVKPANGATDERPLLVTPQAKIALDWSSDGRFLLYANQDPRTQSDLWALPLTGDAKPVPIVHTAFDETQGQFSPDGRWVAYTSNQSGSRDEVYVVPFPEAGGKWQVSTEGGSQPRWRRDGKELFYVAADAKLMAVPISVAPQSRALTAGTPVALFPTHLARGAGISLTGYGSRALYEVTADGRFLMNVHIDVDHPAPITIVQNWVAALKK
jgi:serine/threonine protein kinase/Tol biopolymer transport system component